MIRHGQAPFLECSSRGDRRFSAFFARVRSMGNRSIEEIYQSSKIFVGNDGRPLQVDWRDAKGRRPDNHAECTALYSKLWDIYIDENPALLGPLIFAAGLSDAFGKPGHVCQATELWRIRNRALGEANGRTEEASPQAGHDSVPEKGADDRRAP